MDIHHVESKCILYHRGIMYPPMDDLTADGYDLQFGTNVLGHFFFTSLLIPALLAGASSSPDKTARVVTTSSSAHHPLDFNTFRNSPARTQLGTKLLYAQSKSVAYIHLVTPYPNSDILTYLDRREILYSRTNWPDDMVTKE